MTVKRQRGVQLGASAQLDALVDSAELQDVVFLELHARRPEADDEPESGSSDETIMRVWFRAGKDQIQVRCRFELATPEARFTADAVASFVVTGELPTDEAVSAGFTQRIGVAVVYPYLREAVHDLARKLNVTPPMLSLIAGSLQKLQPINQES